MKRFLSILVMVLAFEFAFSNPLVYNLTASADWSSVIIRMVSSALSREIPIYSPDDSDIDVYMLPDPELLEAWEDEKYSELFNAINNEDYEKAYTYATFLSSGGDKIATQILAAMTMCGAGVAQNYEYSINLLIDLAKDGDERGQYMLGAFGSLYKHQEAMRTILGEDAETDDNIFWYQMMSVDFTSKSFKDSLKWFFTPLEQVAFRDIMYFAGIFCLDGQLGYQNETQGMNWITNSALKGYPDAIEFLNKSRDNE